AKLVVLIALFPAPMYKTRKTRLLQFRQTEFKRKAVARQMANPCYLQAPWLRESKPWIQSKSSSKPGPDDHGETSSSSSPSGTCLRFSLVAAAGCLCEHLASLLFSTADRVLVASCPG